jgi:2-amino-4-hydroxy-6-hydroxymethyldihydropteridine diphosphokinase / dihydropteroate synthase
MTNDIHLALGGNQGDMRGSLRRALMGLGQGGVRVRSVSPLYSTPALLPPGAPAAWDIPYTNLVVAAETDLMPHDVLALAKSVEAAAGRRPDHPRWGPRPMDVDLILWGDQIIDQPTLRIPHAEMTRRAFVLDPLSHLHPLGRIPGEGDLSILRLARRQKNRQPALMGILNITPDSFSDAGQKNNVATAFETASLWQDHGVAWIDVGAESTRPDATPLTVAEEWARLQPVLEALTALRADPLRSRISIDTYHAETAAKALAWGADAINDVSGLKDPAMRDLARQSDAIFMTMHSLSVPARREIVLPEDTDSVALLQNWFLEQIDAWQADGLDPARLILDPGIGFSKTGPQSFAILKAMSAFQDIDARILIGHSRKSFLSRLTDRPFADRDIETLGVSLGLLQTGVPDLLRVHDPILHQRAFQACLSTVS